MQKVKLPTYLFLNSQASLNKITEITEGVSMQVVIKLKDVLKKLADLQEAYNHKRKGIEKRYLKLNETTQNQELKDIKQVDKYNDALEAIAKEEVELNIFQLNRSDFPKNEDLPKEQQISPKDLFNLDWLILIDETVEDGKKK